MIKIKNLTFSYQGQTPVLKDISLSFGNSPTAIIGQNGAGKTTLVKLLKGLLKPTSGDILIQGRNTKEYSAATLSRNIGLIFQNPNDQIFKNRVLDEVMFGPLNLKYSIKEARKKSLEALKLVQMEDKIDCNPYDLSLAERKLISIASILSMEPEIVIFDEPTIAQDYHGIELIKELIKKLSKEGKLVITITHDMDFVTEAFSRAIILRDGSVILDGTIREVFSKPDLLRKSFLEQPHITQLGEKLNLAQTILSLEEFIQYFTTVS